MKHSLTLLFTLVLAALLLAGCASNFKPAPVGDELVWASSDKRPGWTVKTPEVDQGESYIFVGQSLYHGVERAARTNAEVDASAKAATYLAHQLKRQYVQKTTGAGRDNETHVGTVDISETVDLTADQLLSKMAAEDWYIEQWRKGNGTFLKVFVMTRLPKQRL